MLLLILLSIIIDSLLISLSNFLNLKYIDNAIKTIPTDSSPYQFHLYRPHDDRRVNVTLQLFDLKITFALKDVLGNINPSDFYLSIGLIIALFISYRLPEKFNFKLNYTYAVISIMLILTLGVNESFRFVYFQF